MAAQDGTADRTITLNTWNNTGDYYIRVFGRNGSFSLESTFTLQVTLTPGSCGSVDPSSLPATSLAASGPNYKTVVLADWSRMSETPDLQASLASFIARPEVSGVVVDVSQDARVAAANAMAETNFYCPYAKNLVAGAIKSIVDRYRTQNPGLQYVVILGNDSVIPFVRHPDQAMLGDETGFSPPVEDQTASQASLRLGYYLSQDEYGAKVELHLNAGTLAVPSLPVGRLVETPAQITTMLDAYLSTNGGVVQAPTSLLVTGYDFLAPDAEAVKTQLEAGTGVTADTLISSAGTAPADSWTADDLRAKLLHNRYDLMFLAGHFRDSGALAADYTTQVLASEVVSATVNMTNSIIFSAGCHSGYNTVDSAAVLGVTQQPDWAQAFATKGATLIGGTGYQYGDTDFIALSEVLYLDFSQQLRSGTGPVSIGHALAAAKQEYIANKPDLRGTDQKAVAIATLYGLPMLSVDMPGQRITQPAEPSIVSGLTDFTTDPGATLGLASATVTINPQLTLETQPLKDTTSNTIYTTTYLSGSNGTVSNPAEPVLPLETRNVSVPGTVLRGVGFWGGTYSDTTGVIPLVGAAGTEVHGVHVGFPSQVFYPIRLWSVNYYQALSDPADGNTRLMVTPAQFVGDAPNVLTSTLRRFNAMTFRLFYSNNLAQYDGSLPAVSDPPSIAHVFAGINGSDIHFQVRVTGNPAAGIQEVWVTYTDTNQPGTWQSLDLTQNTNDTTLWEGTLPSVADPTAIRYMAQAVNGVGLVALDTNRGAYFIPGIDPGAQFASQTGQATHLALSLTSTSGNYGTQADFTVTLTSNGTPLAGQLINFSLGSQARYLTTDSNGAANVTIPLLELPGQYTVSASYTGTAEYAASTATSSFTITRQATTLTLTPNPATVQLNQTITFTATLQDIAGNPLNEQTVILVVSGNGLPTYSSAQITNFAGQARFQITPQVVGSYDVNVYFGGTPLPGVNLDSQRYLASTTAGTLHVIYNFSGFFPPVDNPPVLNVVKAGSAIPVKFSLNGDLGLNIFAEGYPISQEVTCDNNAPKSNVNETVDANTSGLTYAPGSDQYNYV